MANDPTTKTDQVEGTDPSKHQEEDTVVKPFDPNETVSIDINDLGTAPSSKPKGSDVEEDEEEDDFDDDDQQEVSGLIYNRNFRLILAMIIAIISAGIFWWLLV
ncbi:MAG: hypothetical protein IJU40_09100 [Desulfovibrionaceae bacterium]|nr:hypothetical protein [Desulfovibrionaceae bacterium]